MTPANFCTMRPAAALLLALTLAGGATGCATNEATGELQWDVLSDEKEIELGAEASPQFIDQGGGQIPDQQIQSYVEDIGMRLAAVSERPDLPWEFHALNSPIINAFALPGGKVFVTRGLMERMTNEAQLAAVLGHEVGHVTAKHIEDRMGQAMAIQVAVGAAGVATNSQWISTLGGAGGSLYLLKFGRDQESQSDMLGLRYMTQLNYDPMGMVQLMEILKEASGGGGSEWMQTHPLPDTRIKRTSQIIKEEYAKTQNNPQYTLDAEPFERIVLSRLRNLPPAPQPKQE